jgi:hypothetical protein
MLEKNQIRLDISTHGTVDNDAPFDAQPARIRNLSLKTHQLQSIRAMLNLENNKVQLDDHTLVAEIGILSNKIGSGKSLCVLGLIASNARLDMQPFVTYHFGDAAYVMNERKDKCVRGGNLIVVPNHLIIMWQNYVQTYTDLSCVVVKKQMFPFVWEEIETQDVVLCAATHYNMLIKSCPWMWSRVIFDESDSINIPSCVKPMSRFVWFVSSSLNNLLFCDGHFWKCEISGTGGGPWLTRVVTNGISRNGYIKNTFKKLQSETANCILSKIIVKMNNRYIDELLKLPPIETHVIRCEDPVYLMVLDQAVSEEVTMLLNGDDIRGVMDQYGCSVDTKDNIISQVCKSIAIEIKNLQLKMQYLRNVEHRCEDTHIGAHKLEKTQRKIHVLESKLKRIHSQVESLIDRAPDVPCPICFEDPDDEQCIFTCCMNTFCKTCVQRLSQQNHQSCPLCRGQFSVVTKARRGGGNHGLKYHKVVQLLKEKLTTQDAYILVFMYNDNTLKKVQQVLDSQRIPYRALTGKIQKTVDLFEEGHVRVLVANAMVHGCGLNLTRATDVVLFQKMHTELEAQIIGRAHRIGRTQTLHLHRLLYSNEQDDYTSTCP